MPVILTGTWEWSSAKALTTHSHSGNVGTGAGNHSWVSEAGMGAVSGIKLVKIASPSSSSPNGDWGTSDAAVSELETPIVHLEKVIAQTKKQS